MSIINKLFSHDWFISDIQQKRFRLFYGISILFFISYTVYLFLPFDVAEIEGYGLPIIEVLHGIFGLYLIYSVLSFKKTGWFIFVGSLVSMSVSTLRFFLMSLLINVVEFLICPISS